ncbi:MAG: hypothetical protein ACSLEN_03570 [Candidatus Malihini olakiniferum]
MPTRWVRTAGTAYARTPAGAYSPIQFNDADRAFAAKFQTVMSAEDIANSYARFSVKPKSDESLHEGIYPLYSPDDSFIGSTDVGTVSWVVPTVQIRAGTHATPGNWWYKQKPNWQRN